jgi:putative Mg2+ transporter-C (MgtC) family protein
VDGAAVREAAEQIGAMLVSLALALPMAWDRESRDQSLGLRTFPLIAVAACAFILVAEATLKDEVAVSRVMEGVIAGVGFLGGGAIVKQGPNVRGAATAAAVWSTAALGLAVGRGEYAIAIALAVIGFATLRWLQPLRRIAQQSDPISERTGDAADQGDGEARGDSSRLTTASPEASKASGDTVANSGR